LRCFLEVQVGVGGGTTAQIRVLKIPLKEGGERERRKEKREKKKKERKK